MSLSRDNVLYRPSIDLLILSVLETLPSLEQVEESVVNYVLLRNFAELCHCNVQEFYGNISSIEKIKVLVHGRLH